MPLMDAQFVFADREHAHVFTEDMKVGGSETQVRAVCPLSDGHCPGTAHPREGTQAPQGSGHPVSTAPAIVTALLLATGNGDISFTICQAPCGGLQMLDPIQPSQQCCKIKTLTSFLQRGLSAFPTSTDLVSRRIRAKHKNKCAHLHHTLLNRSPKGRRFS